VDAIVAVGSFNLNQDKNLLSHNSVTEGVFRHDQMLHKLLILNGVHDEILTKIIAVKARDQLTTLRHC
jgi:hypothetical protein